MSESHCCMQAAHFQTRKSQIALELTSEHLSDFILLTLHCRTQMTKGIEKACTAVIEISDQDDNNYCSYSFSTVFFTIMKNISGT